MTEPIGHLQPLRLTDEDVKAMPGVPGWLSGVVRPVAEWVLALGEYNALYRQVLSMGADRHWTNALLELLELDVQVDGGAVHAIPRTGPVMVTANHPAGMLDGVVLLDLVRRVRPDVKIMANMNLNKVPAFERDMLFVDVGGSADSTGRNIPAMRQARQWLDEGHAVVVFPAGRVALPMWTQRRVRETAWRTSIARLIRSSGAAVVPAYLKARNSLLFHAAGLVHRWVRFAVMPRELLRQRGTCVQVELGAPIAASKLGSFDTDRQLIAHLQMQSQVLGTRLRTRRKMRAGQAEPVAKAGSASAITREVAALPVEQRLLEQGDYEVMWGRADQLQHTLQEIGRVREQTFREAGEGTGQPHDLHVIDQHYWHLIAWDRAEQRLVGTYRIGATDEIVQRFGRAGLFTHTMFQLSQGFLDRMGPALELGRAFVRQEYQREYAPLLLLWRGIGSFVARHPQYRMLFGAVSISDDYHRVSRGMLMSFLKEHAGEMSLSGLVAPRRPAETYEQADDAEDALAAVGMGCQAEHVDALIAQLEGPGRGMPVLLRQYLKLGGRVLGFNVTPEFGNTLDGLMVVDLAACEPNVLARYMGKADAAAFAARHGVGEPAMAG